jgi:predicted RND superfamily exporter protein
MRKKLKKYLAFLQDINIADIPESEKASFREDLLAQIGFFQHERLVHLIVTVTVAVLTMLTVLGALAWPGIFLSILTGLLLALLIPYIFHYYTLENGVQKLYEYYDKMVKR